MSDLINEYKNWMDQNSHKIDWNVLRDSWNKMQGWHLPWRQFQLNCMLDISKKSVAKPSTILDLGCGPGFLSQKFLEYYPGAKVIGIDLDPFVSEMARKCLSKYQNRFVLIESDLRKNECIEKLDIKFDIIVSSTALHWLSKDHLNNLFRSIYNCLSPGRIFMNADPVKEESEHLNSLYSNLDLFKNDDSKLTWNSYWDHVKNKYEIAELIDHYLESLNPVEGTDDGYTLDFYYEALTAAGFNRNEIGVFWKYCDQAIYGAVKS